jgi:NADH-quinone oxidoreductase subunit J
MAEVLFFLAGMGAIAGAIGVVALRNPFYCVLALVSHLLSLAALFLLLHAEFVAAAQVVVYAGAVMVLYVFVVAYVGGQDEPLGPRAGRGLRVTAALCGAALFVELCIATLGSGLQAVDTDGAALAPGYGSPAQIGELLLTDFLLPFEVASFLLLIAAVGAVVLARRRGGIGAAEDQARYSAMDMLRPAYTGTMAEAVGAPRPGAASPRTLAAGAAGAEPAAGQRTAGEPAGGEPAAGGPAKAEDP